DEVELADVTVRPEEVKLARQVLNSFATTNDLTDFTDHYQEALRAMIDKKGEVELIAADEHAAKGGNVVNLMDALRQSLDRVSQSKKRPARATTSRRGTTAAAHHSAKRRKAS